MASVAHLFFDGRLLLDLCKSGQRLGGIEQWDIGQSVLKVLCRNRIHVGPGVWDRIVIAHTMELVAKESTPLPIVDENPIEAFDLPRRLLR